MFAHFVSQCLCFVSWSWLYLPIYSLRTWKYSSFALIILLAFYFNGRIVVWVSSSDWQIEAAFDVFYSQPQPKSNGDMRRLKELFNRYKGNMLFLMCFMVLFILKPFATTCLCHCVHGLISTLWKCLERLRVKKTKK